MSDLFNGRPSGATASTGGYDRHRPSAAPTGFAASEADSRRTRADVGEEGALPSFTSVQHSANADEIRQQHRAGI